MTADTVGFYSFKFIKVCCVAQNMVSLVNIPCEIEKNVILLLLDEAVAYQCSLHPVD